MPKRCPQPKGCGSVRWNDEYTQHGEPASVEGRMAGTEIIFEVQESPEGGYEARALGHSIFTEAGTLEELKAMVQDAVHCHFDADAAPRLIRLHLVKDEVIPA